MSPEDQHSRPDGLSPSVPLPVHVPARRDTEAGVAFGRFRLFPRRRLLFAGAELVELGSRAFEILMALIEADGRLVGKEELRRRVWPGAMVEDHNIDVQISALRKAFGEDRGFIRTEAGRGYRFLPKITAIADPGPGGQPLAAAPTNLPTAISVLVGREQELAELSEIVATHRLVTLTGAGGIGKTRLGLEVARRVIPRFADGAWIAELSAVVEPELVAGTIARAVGIEPSANADALDRLTQTLMPKHLLLVLDNCEHLIDAAAAIAERLLHGAPRLSILATSQEPLAAEGERLYRVAPLRVPPAQMRGAAEALEHSAVELFVERAQAADPLFALDDRSAAAASKICRDLDGIPLAIELAAARVATIGVEALAARLDDRFRLLTGGRRTALRRHQTLRATLDWSYGLLEESKRASLRRIAIFAGSFTLDSACVVSSGGGIDRLRAADQMADLVRKSLVTVDLRAAVPRYRLLDTTRAYALEKLAESGEFEAVARRHAEHYRGLLDEADIKLDKADASELVARYGPEIDNIRAAIAWAFAPHGDPEIGIVLAAMSAPLWILLSMLGECLELATEALSRLGDVANAQPRHEMLLQAALAKSSMWARGPVAPTGAAAERALALAERLGDDEHRLQVLYILWIYRIRTGAYEAALAVAQQFREIAEARGDSPVVLAADRLEGVCCHFLGDNAKARAAMERLLDNELLGMHRSLVVRFGMYQRASAFAYLSSILWLQGFPEQAMRTAMAGIEEARALNHANSLCMALCDGACAVGALSGDPRTVEESAAVLVDCADKHGLGMWRVYGIAFKGWLALRHGDPATGLRLLRQVLGDFHETRVDLRYTVFLEAWTDAAAGTGGLAESLDLIGEALAEVERTQGRWCLAELLRIRGELRLREDRPEATADAERDFVAAVAVAERQGARSWQLRAATSLARLYRREDRIAAARDVLLPVYRGFSEGFETADLKAARALLDELS